MLNLRITLRFLIKKPIQTFITLIVIAIGTAIFYFVLNAGASLEELVLTTTADANSHIYVTGDFDFTSYNDEAVINFRNAVFEEDERITDISYSYSTTASVKVVTAQAPKSITLKGIDFEEGKAIQRIGARIAGYEFNSFPKSDAFDDYFGEIAIGNRLANDLGYKKLSEAIGNIVDINCYGNNYSFKIVAVHSTDQLELSSRIVFTTIETMQKLTNLQKANAIEILVLNPRDSEDALINIQDIIEETYPESSSIQWQEGNRYAVNALYIEEVSILIIQIFTAISISFGVAALLLFTIREKINQIGILKALGLNNFDTRKIFSYQIIMLALIGIFGGLLLGDFLAKFFQRVFTRPNSNVPLIVLHTGITNFYAVLSAIIMFASCLIATLPSIGYAEKLKIIEVIKDE